MFIQPTYAKALKGKSSLISKDQTDHAYQMDQMKIKQEKNISNRSKNLLQFIIIKTV